MMASSHSAFSFLSLRQVIPSDHVTELVHKFDIDPSFDTVPGGDRVKSIFRKWLVGNDVPTYEFVFRLTLNSRLA